MLKSYWCTSELGSRSHCAGFLSQIESSGSKDVIFSKRRRLKIFWDSQTHGLAGPQKLAVLVFFNSVWLARTGRATPETHHQARLAQTDSRNLCS
jgi:hypothetical protein